MLRRTEAGKNIPPITANGVIVSDVGQLFIPFIRGRCEIGKQNMGRNDSPLLPANKFTIFKMDTEIFS